MTDKKINILDPKLHDKEYLKEHSDCYFMSSIKRLLSGNTDYTYKVCPNQSYYSSFESIYNRAKSDHDAKINTKIDKDFLSKNSGCFIISNATRLLDGDKNATYKICFNQFDHDTIERIYEHAKIYTYGNRPSDYRL